MDNLQDYVTDDMGGILKSEEKRNVLGIEKMEMDGWMDGWQDKDFRYTASQLYCIW